MSSTTKDIDQLSERKELPEGWRWVKLGEIFDITSSKRVFESDWTRQGVPFYRAREIVKLSQQGFVENDLFISEAMFAEYSAKYGIPQTGDIMVTGVGTLGICHVVREGDKFYFKDGNIIWLKKKSENESSFIEYAFRSDLLRKQIDDSSGATVGTFTIIKAKNTCVPLPPLPEQQRIAAILKEQMGAVEKGRKAAQERLRAIKALPAAFLRQIFPDPGQPLPEGWRWAKLGDVCDIKGGKRLPAGTDFVDDYSPFPYIRVVDLKNGTVDTNNLKYLDEATQSLISRYIIGKDDIYISIAGTIGIIGMIPECLDGANLTENAAKLVVQDKKNVFRDFLALFLTSPLGKDFICERTNIVGQPKLALTRIATIPILLPPFSEQKCIAELFNKQMAMVEKARIAAEAELKAINTLPAALLRRAFNGEL